VLSCFLPAHEPHEIFIGEEGYPIDREGSQHGDAQTLEKCFVAFSLVLLPCAVHHAPVPESSQILRLGDGLDIVDRVCEEPRIGTCYSTGEEGSVDGSLGRVFTPREESHNVFIGIEVYSIGCNFSPESRVEAKVESSQAMPLQDVSPCVY
jgi:hypothetical protein